jgi:hypothetical protein
LQDEAIYSWQSQHLQAMKLAGKNVCLELI